MLPIMSVQVPRVVELAERLARDIRDRELQPGDPYLSTAEAARMLRVSTTLANRALQLLAQRCVHERRQRKGAVVATLPHRAGAGELAKVHLVVPAQDERSEGIALAAYHRRRVRVGEALLEFHRLRPPCVYLDRLLQPGAARALGKAGGIGLRVVEGGVIRVGDPVTVLVDDA